MPKKGRISNAEADLQMMRLRQENMVAHHKATMEEYRVRQSIQAAERIKNLQNQYGALLEATSRIPVGLQRETFQRMTDLGRKLEEYRNIYPQNFPDGPTEQSRNMSRMRRGYI